MDKIVEITVTSFPDKLMYYPGESLNLAGLKIDAVTAEGKSIDVTKDCVITPKTHVFTERDSEVNVKADYAAQGQTFTTFLSTSKINEYHENKVITGEYDKSLAVECNNGIFVGKIDGDVIMYRGIPFVAEQPTGKNRYKVPVGYDYSAPKDKTVREAYYFGKEALQEVPASYPTGEDCLYLNIYKNSKDAGKKKPVMVWIHGGAWVMGGTAEPPYNLYNITEANPDVIFASIPYRLSLLGFANLSSLKGYTDEYKNMTNLGLLDLAEALHWIHENIAAFGGDPDNITIFGESAGGGCSSLLPLMKEARPYFKKAIPQSGTPAFTRSKEYAVAVSKKVFDELHITSVDDFFKADPEALMAANIKYGDLCSFPERDGNILPVHPFEAYAEGVAKDITLMTGCNKDEGSFWFCKAINHDLEPIHQYFAEKDGRLLSLMTDKEKADVQSFMKDAEKDGHLQSSRFFDQYMFVGQSFRLADAQVEGGGTAYQYFFTAETIVPDLKSAHGTDVHCVFGNESSYLTPAADSVFSKTMQKMWIQFAKTGNPSLPAEVSPTGKAIEWPKKTSPSGAVMQMDEDKFHVEYDLGEKMVDRKRIYPLLKYYGEKPSYL